MFLCVKKFLGSIPSLVKAIGFVSKASAQYPIHVILIVLLLATFSYLAVMEMLFDKWSVDFNNFIVSMRNGNVTDRSSHDHWISKEFDNYINYQDTACWIKLDDKYSKKINDIFIEENFQHYYLFDIIIDHNFKKLLNFSELSPNIIYENSTLFILTKEKSLNIEGIFRKELNKKWDLTDLTSPLNYFDIVIRKYKENIFSLNSILKNGTGFIIIAYLHIFYLILNLFTQMKNYGSNFWLGFMALISSGCSIMLALYSTYYVTDIEISLTELFTGLPFILVVVGFKHKIIMTKDITDKFSRVGVIDRGEISKLISESVMQNGNYFLQEYLISMISFIVCSFFCKDVEFAKNVCILSAFVLIWGMLLTITFFCSILSLKLEINIIHLNTEFSMMLEEEEGHSAEFKEEVIKKFVLKTPSTIKLAKIFIVGIIIVINCFELFLILLTNKNIYSYSLGKVNIPLPKIKSIINSHNHTSTSTLLSIAPSQYLHMPRKFYRDSVVDYILVKIYKYTSYAIQDKLISKILLCSFAISCSVNMYLLNVAKCHTTQSVKKLFNENDTKLNNQKTKERNTKLSIAKYVNEGKGLHSLATCCDTEKSTGHAIKTDLTGQTPQAVDSKVDNKDNKQINHLVNEYEANEDDKEIIDAVVDGQIPLYSLEKRLGDKEKAVFIRRTAISKMGDIPILATNALPYQHYDYERVFGACCENVIGYMPLPVGLIGPMLIDGISYHIPMATTEGCLVASAMRGCKAMNAGGGVTTVVTKDGMTRGPCVTFPTLKRSGECKIWLDSPEGQEKIKAVFNSTSRFARLQHIQTALAGDLLFIRFRTTTGDAMGMNMISKGVEHSLSQMKENFGWDDMEVISISGNYCTDKKAAAINWIEGRGKSVVAEALIPGKVVRDILKSDVKALVELNISKNLISSAVAGSIGGFNAHAANLVTAVFLALGQDPAQNVESSNCLTLMNEVNGDLKISVSMPSIEVGTIGGGTILEPQGAMLELLGVRGPHPTEPGENSRRLATIVASTVLAGELSLCAALSSGHLVQSHMSLNRSKN